MPTIFSKIINNEIPAYKIDENNEFIAFLDIFPLAKGHTLIVPKVEIDYIFDIEDDLLGRMNIFAKKVAKAIDEVIDCERVGVAVIGLEVPHAHIHLIPINNIQDINFARPKLKFSEEEFIETCNKIKSKIQL